MGEGHRRDVVQSEEILDHALEGGQRFGGFQIANVLAQEDVASQSERHDVLQVAAHGKEAQRYFGSRSP